MGRPTDHPQDLNGHRSGDWTCPCGQSYRVLAMTGEVRLWPKNSSNGYRLEPIGDYCFCGSHIARGTVLCALFGAAVSAADQTSTARPNAHRVRAFGGRE